MKLLEWVAFGLICEITLVVMAMVITIPMPVVVINGEPHHNYWLAAGISFGILNVMVVGIAIIILAGYLVTRLFKLIAKKGSLSLM